MNWLIWHFLTVILLFQVVPIFTHLHSLQKGVSGINMMASYPIKTIPNPPPAPPPGPVKCGFFSPCPGGETCCCSWELLGICLSRSCCALESAVCCKDHHHCCPRDYPICDLQRNQCLKKTGNSTLVKQLQNKGLFGELGNWKSFYQKWNL